jgi:peptide/nickel transport system substrate-binding protein
VSRKFDVVSTLAILLTSAGVAALGSAAKAEVPMLQARVEAGELPPLAERLPERPEVVTPLESVGTYGGTIRRGLRGSSDYNNLLRFVGPQGLTRWNLDYTEILPNVAESYEISDDGAVFTFHLRPGMKWSDGEPFSADDILFNMEDLVLNEEFAPISPTYMVDGVPVEVEKVGDQTVTFTFAGPYGDFPGGTRLAARPASGAVSQTLLQPVPPDLQQRH